MPAELGDFDPDGCSNKSQRSINPQHITSATLKENKATSTAIPLQQSKPLIELKQDRENRKSGSEVSPPESGDNKDKNSESIKTGVTSEISGTEI